MLSLDSSPCLLSPYFYNKNLYTLQVAMSFSIYIHLFYIREQSKLVNIFFFQPEF